MVQILPPKTNLGTQLGQALGSGLSQGIQKGSDVGFQRGMIQNALEGLSNLPSGTSPLEATKYLLTATAGLPDQGRIMQALAPYLIGGARAGAAFGPGGLGGGLPGQQVSPQMQQGTIQNIPETQQEPKSIQQPQYGGFFQRPRTPAEMNTYSAQYAQLFPEDPNAYLRGQQIAQSENANIQKSWENFTDQAISQNSDLQKKPDRIPIYKEILQKKSNLSDPIQIAKEANQEYREVANLFDVFNEAEIPGLAKGILEKTGKVLSKANLIPAFLMKDGHAREKALKNYSNTAKEIAKRGFEPQLRSQLSQQYDLSRTEMDELFHPLTEKNIQSLSSLSDSRRIPEKERINSLKKFFKENITSDTSLLALRHKLWDEKGYNWQEIGPAIRASGVPLNTRQDAEMATVEGEPPIQSMTDIFRGWGRWIDYLRGSK